MKKILYILLIVLLLIPLIFIYIVFNGNPLAKMQAKKDLQAYLAETYPNDTFQIKSNRFDPEFAYYWFDVSIDKDPEKQTYLFEVPTSFSQYQEIEDGIFYANLDEPLIDKWTKQAKEAIKQLLEKDVQAIRELDLYMYVLQDKYDIDEEWTPETKMDKPMEVHMIIAAENMSRDEVFQLTKKLQQLFNQEDYDYKEIAISYYIPYEGDWIVRYMSQFTPKQDIRKKDIEVHNEFLFK